MDFSSTPGYHGYVEININACLIAFSTLFYGTRLYVRAFMTKTLGLDDAAAAVAYAFLVVQSALDMRAVSLGSGSHIDLVPEPILFQFFESLTIQILVYFWGVGSVRIAILAFLPRLSQDKIIIRCIYVLSFIVFAQTLVAFAYRLAECTPVADNFKPPFLPGLNCKGFKADEALIIGHAIVGIVLDFALLFLPVYIIYTKMIWSRQTIQVILVLSVGVFVIITGIVRLFIILTLNFLDDPTYKMATIGIWTNMEGHIGLWCCCFPALQPILRIISFKLGLRSKLTSSKGNTRDKYHYPSRGGGGEGLASAGGGTQSSKNGYVMNGSGIDECDDETESQRAIVMRGSNVELGDLESRGIQKTTEIKVSITEGPLSRPNPRPSGDGHARKASKSWVDVSS